MRILVATNAGGLDDNVSMVFARAPTFTIIEAEGSEIKNVDVIPNQFANAVHGAGIQAGQFVASQGINVVIAGNFGPNVSSILAQHGIQMISTQGKVRDVVEKFLKGELASPSMRPPMQLPPPPPPQPMQPVAAPPSSPDIKERIKMLEEQIARIEDLVEDVKKALKELKEE